ARAGGRGHLAVGKHRGRDGIGGLVEIQPGLVAKMPDVDELLILAAIGRRRGLGEGRGGRAAQQYQQQGQQPMRARPRPFGGLLGLRNKWRRKSGTS
nr:hypothetical protein [Tanacetum cinerariifolium]